MKEVKASTVLPHELILEIQKYIQGETIYIPKAKSACKRWGTCSGIRQSIDERNAAMKQAFQNGATMEHLAEEYHLAIETVKKIIYTKK
ncbi:Mor family transcriptional regulator [Bacillus ectoiniformans]|uniref:CD3324 family protein n=1 Tax=Bacillus ectoiniformans TaxID=1494429 RepID=UPI00195AC849|nr:CD3324 family protein [Bacillus ectoiniformans]MBM7648657.1 Mor family transcriptional regulator [Bacillus ectoiniformans]MBM7648659.1 Mor family transcriptional regulator [Bacillus ectoiniformans]